MQKANFALSRVLTVLAWLLICKVTLSIVIGYRHYLPPNFQSEFLQGREAYFWGPYGWAFYLHLVSGPASLMLGMILLSNRFRRMAPAWHGRLGRLQAAVVLFLLAPSGLWMAWYAESGAVAAAGLGLLAIATAACTLLGVKAAFERRFAEHERWLRRVYMLLCSAVAIRLIGGAASVAGLDALWLYPLSTWASWLVPLVVFESVRMLDPAVRRVAVPSGGR